MNIKKIAALALAASMLMAMAACTSEAQPVSSDVKVIATESQNGSQNCETGAAPTVDENAASENYVFTYQGVNVIVSTSMNDIIDSLNAVAGEPKYFEAASCADDGMSKTYTYNGGSFTVSTNPNGPVDVIANITLYDDTVSTAEESASVQPRTKSALHTARRPHQPTQHIPTRKELDAGICFRCRQQSQHNHL